MKYFSIYCTTRDENEANQIAKTIVSERLVACVNILQPVKSFYWWEDKLQMDFEFVFFAKTSETNVTKAIARIRELHNYKTPCIVSFEIAQGDSDYLQWISSQLK